MAKDLDKLAEVIKGALQEERPVVGAKPGSGTAVSVADKEVDGESAAAILPNRAQDLKSDKWQDLNQKDTERTKQKGARFFS